MLCYTVMAHAQEGLHVWLLLLLLGNGLTHGSCCAVLPHVQEGMV
jgi:hypothetical protein